MLPAARRDAKSLGPNVDRFSRRGICATLKMYVSLKGQRSPRLLGLFRTDLASPKTKYATSLGKRTSGMAIVMISGMKATTAQLVPGMEVIAAPKHALKVNIIAKKDMATGVVTSKPNLARRGILLASYQACSKPENDNYYFHVTADL